MYAVNLKVWKQRMVHKGYIYYEVDACSIHSTIISMDLKVYIFY